jgi:hypothetical protein
MYITVTLSSNKVTISEWTGIATKR